MTNLRKQSDGTRTTSHELFSLLRSQNVSLNETVFNFGAAGYDIVFPAPQPAHDAMTQSVRETTAVLTGANWEQRWETVPLPAETVTANIAAQAALASTEYQRLRAAEYNLKTTGEQFGMQYDDAKSGTTTWRAWQDEIKARIPKPV